MKNIYLSICARFLPYFLIIGYIVGLIITLLIGKYSFAISGSILAIPAVIAVITLIYLFHHNEINLLEIVSFFPFKHKTLVLLFGIIYSFTIIIGLLCSQGSPIFLGGMVVLYILILLQIFSHYRLHPYEILIQIMLTMLTLIYENTIKPPYYFGWTDIFGHIFIATVTYLSGHVIPPDLGSGYEFFPLFHIWMSMSSFLLDLNIKISYYLITGPIYIITIVILYYIFKSITKNIQISLLTCLLYSIDPIVTFYGSYMITRVAAYIGFIFLLYLLLKLDKINGSSYIKFLLVSIVITIYILLVHQVSILQILFLLSILLGCLWFVGSKSQIWFSFFVLMSITLITYWVWVAFQFGNSFILPRLKLGFSTMPEVMTNTIQYSPFIFFMNHIHTIIFLFFAIIGIGYLFWIQKIEYETAFSLFTLFTITLYIPTPLQSIWQINSLLRLDRFMLLIAPFMAFIMGFGLYIMLMQIKTKISSKISLFIIILIFIIYCIGSLGILSMVENPAEQVTFTQEELKGIDFINSNVPYGTTLYSDFYIGTYYLQPFFSETKALKMPYYESNIIQNVQNIATYQGLVIIPIKQFLEKGLTLKEGVGLSSEGKTYGFLPSKDTQFLLKQSLEKKNRIFNDKYIDIYSS